MMKLQKMLHFVIWKKGKMELNRRYLHQIASKHPHNTLEQNINAKQYKYLGRLQ